MMRWFVVGMTLLLALPAAAWNDCGPFGSAADATGQPFRPGSVRCHDTTATVASDVLNVSACDHFDATLDPDMASTGAGCEGYLWRCTSSTYSANACRHASVDTDGDGVPDDVTLDGVTTGRQGQQYQTATWIYWAPTANAGSKQCRLMISCY